VPQWTRGALAIGCVAAVSWTYTHVLPVTNSTIVALTLLLIVLVVGATSTLWAAVVTSVAAMAAFNFFFLPPVGTLAIADPENWVVLGTFLAVSLVATNLSSAVRAREREALERRDEMARLLDLSRDVLQMTDRDAISGLATVVASRFGLSYAAVCLPRVGGWDVHAAGALPRPLDLEELSAAFAGFEGALEPTAGARTRKRYSAATAKLPDVRFVPLRVGAKSIGVLAAAGRAFEQGALDALGGVVAIAVDRAQLLEAGKAAEMAQQREAVKSALLASLGHDLRTPLTAIRVAATNLQSSWLAPEDLREQSAIVLSEVERLARLFQNILDMARIDAGGVSPDERWVHPMEIVDAARDLVAHALGGRPLNASIGAELLVKVDPRLTAAALSHLLENAAQYSPPGSPIDVGAQLEGGTVTLTVRDYGPGIAAADLPRLFERFYRGRSAASRAEGTGMGLAIARGLLAAERGRVWAENAVGGGALFTIAFDSEVKRAEEGLVEIDA